MLDKEEVGRMKELIFMLGIETKLEFNNNIVNDVEVAGAKAREPD